MPAPNILRSKTNLIINRIEPSDEGAVNGIAIQCDDPSASLTVEPSALYTIVPQGAGLWTLATQSGLGRPEGASDLVEVTATNGDGDDSELQLILYRTGDPQRLALSI